jgi:polysaccharide biosynthesis/export protein
MEPKMSFIRLTVLVVVAVVAGIPFSAAVAQERDEIRAPYKVNAGDTLEISVWKEPDLQRSVLVRPDGAYSFPLAGEAQAEGRTVTEIREELTRLLESFVPGLVVTVTVSQIGGNKIFVIGQVRSPGEFVMNPRVDVMQALSIAGGTTTFAQLNDIKILRRKDNVQTAIRFRYADVVKGQNLEQNIMLEVGDVVVVP